MKHFVADPALWPSGVLTVVNQDGKVASVDLSERERFYDLMQAHSDLTVLAWSRGMALDFGPADTAVRLCGDMDPHALIARAMMEGKIEAGNPLHAKDVWSWREKYRDLVS